MNKTTALAVRLSGLGVNGLQNINNARQDIHLPLMSIREVDHFPCEGLCMRKMSVTDTCGSHVMLMRKGVSRYFPDNLTTHLFEWQSSKSDLCSSHQSADVHYSWYRRDQVKQTYGVSTSFSIDFGKNAANEIKHKHSRPSGFLCRPNK